MKPSSCGINRTVGYERRKEDVRVRLGLIESREISKSNCGPVKTYVDKLVVISLLEIMQYRSVVEVCQVRHVLGFLIFRWVYLRDLLLLEGLLLWKDTSVK